MHKDPSYRRWWRRRRCRRSGRFCWAGGRRWRQRASHTVGETTEQRRNSMRNATKADGMLSTEEVDASVKHRRFCASIGLTSCLPWVTRLPAGKHAKTHTHTTCQLLAAITVATILITIVMIQITIAMILMLPSTDFGQLARGQKHGGMGPTSIHHLFSWEQAAFS